MKLLLTSNGLSNPSIARALFELVGKPAAETTIVSPLFELVGKPAAETTIVFIPTAMNVASGDKGWFINDLYNLKKQGCKFIDIVDISALPIHVWKPKMEAGDVLFFSGGNSSHLMYWLKESGLAELLPDLLKTRVYAGISTGSIVTSPTLALSRSDKKIFYEEKFGYRSEEALRLVDIYIRPHYNSPKHILPNKEDMQRIAQETGKIVYALDDESALKIEDNAIEVITEGEYLKYYG